MSVRSWKEKKHVIVSFTASKIAYVRANHTRRAPGGRARGRAEEEHPSSREKDSMVV